MDFGNVVASQRLVLFLISKVICCHNVHGFEIQILRHLKATPKFGWSCPAAQISAWSHDTKNQKNHGEVAQEYPQDQTSVLGTTFRNDLCSGPRAWQRSQLLTPPLGA